MKIYQKQFLVALGFFIAACERSADEVNQIWEAKIIKVDRCSVYSAGEKLKWKIKYNAKSISRTIYENGPDGISHTEDDVGVRVESVNDFKKLKYMSDAKYEFGHAYEGLIKNTDIVKIVESTGNVDYETNESNVLQYKSGETAFALHGNGVRFYAHTDGGGALEVSGEDSAGKYMACLIVIGESSLSKSDNLVGE